MKTMINCMKTVEQRKDQLYSIGNQYTTATQKYFCTQENFHRYNLFVICFKPLVNLE